MALVFIPEVGVAERLGATYWDPPFTVVTWIGYVLLTELEEKRLYWKPDST
jgi:hypothetical protein